MSSSESLLSAFTMHSVSVESLKIEDSTLTLPRSSSCATRLMGDEGSPSSSHSFSISPFPVPFMLQLLLPLSFEIDFDKFAVLIDGALFLNHMLVRFGIDAVDVDLTLPLLSVESSREYDCDDSSVRCREFNLKTCQYQLGIESCCYANLKRKTHFLVLWFLVSAVHRESKKPAKVPHSSTSQR